MSFGNRQTMPSQSITANNQVCWVIRWEGNQFAKDFIHASPARWNCEEVENYLIGLYYNSPGFALV
jgi:hypothetical protein